MTERRRFLRTASLLSLSAFDSSARGALASGSEPAAEPAESADEPPYQAPTPPPSIQEQPFADYHLSGKPDENARLFGDARPQNWQETKAKLKASIAAEGSLKNEPIGPWLATFDDSFDTRASNIVLAAAKSAQTTTVSGTGSSATTTTTLKYEPQLYDASLRAASALLDRCLRYRNEMGGFESAGVNAGISYLSFVKLRPLQRNFLNQSNSADLSEIERTTENTVAQRYHQIWGLGRLFERRQLQAKEEEAKGFAEELGLAEAKDNFLTKILQKQFHYQIDAQLAQFTRLISPGSSSNYAERYLRMLAMLAEDLADAYCRLYSASKGIQKVLGITNISVGLNPSVSVDIKLFSTVDDIATWISQIIPATATQKSPDILDALVMWTRAVMRTIDTNSQYETEFMVSIPLMQAWGQQAQGILSGNDLNAAFPPSGSGTFAGKLSFALGTDALPIRLPAGATATNVRTIGIGLSVEFSEDDASPVQYMQGFPATATPTTYGYARPFEQNKMARLNATVTTPGQNLQGSTTPYNRPTVFLANVRIQGGNGGDLEPALCYDPSCRGLDPFGRWTITFDPQSLEIFRGDKSVETLIKGFVLHLRLRGTLN